MKNYKNRLRLAKVSQKCGDVTDSESASESDGIRHFFQNPTDT